MEKEDLIRVIYNHNEYLIESIEQIKKDIAYQNDLLKINEKHSKRILLEKIVCMTNILVTNI